MNTFVVCAMYRFVALPDYVALRDRLLTFLEERQIKGSLLLASEGINGTVAGERSAIDALIDWLQQDERFAKLDCKFSTTHELPLSYQGQIEERDCHHGRGGYRPPRCCRYLRQAERLERADC